MGELLGAILQPVFEAVCGFTAIYAMPTFLSGGSASNGHRPETRRQSFSLMIGLRLSASRCGQSQLRPSSLRVTGWSKTTLGQAGNAGTVGYVIYRTHESGVLQ